MGQQLWFYPFPIYLFSFTLLLSKGLHLLLLNQCVVRFPKKSVTKFRRRPTSPSPRRNAEMFLTPSVLMFRNASARSLKDLSKSLSPERNADFNTGKSARQLKIPGSNVPLFKMSSATLFPS